MISNATGRCMDCDQHDPNSNYQHIGSGHFVCQSCLKRYEHIDGEWVKQTERKHVFVGFPDGENYHVAPLDDIEQVNECLKNHIAIELAHLAANGGEELNVNISIHAMTDEQVASLS